VEMGDAGPVMDDDMDVNEFFQILAEPPASPLSSKFIYLPTREPESKFM